MVRIVLFMLVVGYGIMNLAGSAFAQTSEDLSHEERVVAITILAEARGEGSEGMEAVACVIQQRSVERKITPSAVCLQRLQFSCWNNKMTVDKLSAQVTRKTSPEIIGFATRLAKDLVAGKDLDRGQVGFANHYCTTAINPKWTKGRTPVKVVGNHKFFRL